MVRRIFARPIPLGHRPRQEPDGWLLADPSAGPVARLHGPFVVSGGWWRRLVHREYHFAETKRGDVVWIYFDRRRRRWFLQGRVE
jgi:protein ImuB